MLPMKMDNRARELPTMPHEIAGAAKCRICRKVFLAPPVVVVGSSRAETFVGQLTTHLVSEHTEDAKACIADSRAYAAMLMMKQFEVSDSETFQEIDAQRWAVHQTSLSGQVTKKAISDLVAKIVPELMTLSAQGDSATIAKNLTGMIYGFTELEKYLPKGPSLG